jgi:predicted ATP-grasp superfamily ATP-dependent carboligase
MLGALISWGSVQTEKPVLFYNGDHDLRLVSEHREQLAKHFSFVVAETQLVEDLVDKERFARLAEKLDLPVPPSVTVDPASAGPGAVDMPFPLVIKPLQHRHETWNPMSGGAKAIQIHDRGSLEGLWPRLRDQGPVIAQTLIPGPESRIESYHAYVRDTGEIHSEFAGRKIRTLPLESGDTTALEITDEPDVMALGRALVARLRLTGVAKFDLKRAPDGRLWLLEVNPRFNLWHHAGAVAGTNIPHAVFADLTGAPPPPSTLRPGVTWCHPTHDLRAARAAGIGIGEWMRFVRRCDARWGMSWADPMPFVRGVLVRRLVSKLRRP